MKKISTLLLSSLFSLALLAKPTYDDPYLSISSFSTGKGLQVEVDGRRYNFDNDNSITLRNLSTGSHAIKITKNRMRNNNNRIFDFGAKRETIYNSRIYLRRGYDFDITINKFGKVFTDEARIDDNNDWNAQRDRDWGDDRDNGYGNSRNDDNGYGNNRDQDNHDRDYNDRNDDRNGNRDYDDDRDNDYDNNYHREMSQADFTSTKQTLRREIYENTRLDLAKQVINTNYFTSQQVKELLQLFTFENNKLDLAKYAYKNTVDRKNYSTVNDVFTFSNSRDELARYIRDYKD
jgi:hypothetical protein